MKTILLGALFAASLLADFHAVILIGGVWVDMSTLSGAPYSGAWAVSPSGVVVGSSGSPTLHPGTGGTGFGDGVISDLAFSYSGGVMTSIGYLGTIAGDLPGNSQARAINASGTIVGKSAPVYRYYPPGCSTIPCSLPAYTQTHAFSYTVGGGIVDLDPANPSQHSTANGISDTGVIVGEFYPVTTGNAHAFSYDGSTWNDLGTLGGRWSTASAISPNGNFIAGISLTSSDGMHLFSYSSSTMTDLGKPSWGCYMASPTHAAAVNDSGVIAGSDCMKGFYYSGGTFNAIPQLGSDFGHFVTSITAAGVIYGWSIPSWHPFSFAISGATMTDLGLAAASGNWNLVWPTGANASGAVVGMAQ